MAKSVADFIKLANEEEIINRNDFFKKATRGVELDILEIPEWAKVIFWRYLSLEINLDKMLKKMKNAASIQESSKTSFYLGLICGRIEEFAIKSTIEDNDINLLKLKDIPLLAKKYDFTFALSTFLDDFKHAYNKYSLIKTAPLESDYITKKDYCFLAATAHKLANDNNIPVPEWIHDPKYILDVPYYAFKSEEAQQYLKKISPAEFKARNIFTTENVIERV